jgi:hypothetical protein
MKKMDPKNLADMNKVMLSAMHEMFTTGMNAMNMMQAQAERMVKALQDKNFSTYNLSGGVMDEWISSVKTGQDEFRKIIDENFKRAETHLNSIVKQEGKGK